MLEKKINLRSVEFVFTDDQVHASCNCEYQIVITEDGKEISRNTFRESSTIEQSRDLILTAQTYVHPTDAEMKEALGL